MENGMTCTPVPTEQMDGSISYHFDVQDNSYVSEGSEMMEEDSGYYLDEHGNHHHIMEDVNFEQFEVLDEDYIPELTDEDFLGGVTLEDQQYIRDSVGGDESYAEVVSWARQNLNPNIINAYNEILEEGDVELIEVAINDIQKLYYQNADIPFSPSQSNQVRQQASNEDFYSLVGGRENYQQMMDIAADRLDGEAISRFNHVMSKGSAEDISVAIRWLQQKLSQ